jgi:hypothetical protein
MHGGTSKHNSCAKNSLRLFTVTRHMSGEYISVSNGKRSVSNVKKRAKMFAVCAWIQIAVCFKINESFALHCGGTAVAFLGRTTYRIIIIQMQDGDYNKSHNIVRYYLLYFYYIFEKFSSVHLD